MHFKHDPETACRARSVKRPAGTTPSILFFAMVLTVLMSAGAVAHGVDFRIQHGDAVMVYFSSHHDGPMVGAGFRVFTPAGREVFVSGSTDALGRAVFAPDRPGHWRVLMATEDGHGAEVEVVIEGEEGMPGAAASQSPASPIPGTRRLSSTAAGVGYLFGIAGLLALWRHRR